MPTIVGSGAGAAYKDAGQRLGRVQAPYCSSEGFMTSYLIEAVCAIITGTGSCAALSQGANVHQVCGIGTVHSNIVCKSLLDVSKD